MNTTNPDELRKAVEHLKSLNYYSGETHRCINIVSIAVEQLLEIQSSTPADLTSVLNWCDKLEPYAYLVEMSKLTFDTLVKAARHSSQIDHVNGELLAKVQELQSKLAEVEREVAKWKAGCLANAEDAKNAHEVSENRRLELLNIHSLAKKLAEALRNSTFFCEDYLRTVTHPGVSRLVSDSRDALTEAKQAGLIP